MRRALAYIMSLVVLGAAAWTPYTAYAQVLPGSPFGGGSGGGGSGPPFSDATFAVCDDGDPTKCWATQASGITTGNTITPSFSGTTAAPIFGLSGGTINFGTSGLGQDSSTGAVGISAGGVGFVLFNRPNLEFGSTAFLVWSNAAAPAGTRDVGLARQAAGELRATGATAGTYGNISAAGFLMDKTITAAGTTGNQTINKNMGTVNIAAAAATVTVTNSTVSTGTICAIHARTNDATCSVKNYVPTAGSLVINTTANCTAETSFGFACFN